MFNPKERRERDRQGTATYSLENSNEYRSANCKISKRKTKKYIASSSDIEREGLAVATLINKLRATTRGMEVCFVRF